MATWLIAVVGLIYLYVAVEFVFKQEYGAAIMYFSYAAANVGLIMMALHK